MTDSDTLVFMAGVRMIHAQWLGKHCQFLCFRRFNWHIWSMRKLKHQLKDGKIKGNSVQHLVLYFQLWRKCVLFRKKKIEAIPLTRKAKESISSKVSRNMDSNYCFSDAETTIKAMLIKKQNIVEMSHFCSALETNLIPVDVKIFQQNCLEMVFCLEVQSAGVRENLDVRDLTFHTSCSWKYISTQQRVWKAQVIHYGKYRQQHFQNLLALYFMPDPCLLHH